MTEVFETLSVIGDPITEEDRVVHLLACLPEAYDMIVMALESSPNVLPNHNRIFWITK